jgi:hypothetical protein
MNNQNFQNQPMYQPQQEIMRNQQTGNILFVADLSDEVAEEDLSLFFKDYKFKFAKVFK